MKRSRSVRYQAPLRSLPPLNCSPPTDAVCLGKREGRGETRTASDNRFLSGSLKTVISHLTLEFASRPYFCSE
jgi:hypothetical protein